MRRTVATSMMVAAGWMTWTAAAAAAEPQLAIVEISADEPKIGAFSLERAAVYLDRAATSWQSTHACVACHTMLPYLMARGAIEPVSPQSIEVRRFFEEVAAGKREAMPNYACHDVAGAAAIGVAAAMAINDRATSGKLHPLTRQALDGMWTLQRADGGWEWPFRDTPPLKVNEHYGVTLAAIAAGMAPDGYADTPAARAGVERIRKFLANKPAVTLHERAMLLWASMYVDDLLPADAQQKIVAELLSTQRADGGWSLASLVDNTADPSLANSRRTIAAKQEPGYGSEFLLYVGPEKVYKSSLSSDGYATGFVIFVARQAGVPVGDARLRRGIEWLKANQRESGRWFTPSQAWHTRNLISNAGTGYAILALEACGEVPREKRLLGVSGN